MARDGRVDWRWRTGGDIVGVATSPTSNNVYFVALDNVLRALNLKSGGQQWMRPLPFRPVWAPVQVAGTIVVAGQSPSLRAYKISDGTSAGDVSAAAEIAAAAHVVENTFTGLPTVLIVTHDIKAGAAALLITRTIEPASTSARTAESADSPAAAVADVTGIGSLSIGNGLQLPDPIIQSPDVRPDVRAAIVTGDPSRASARRAT